MNAPNQHPSEESRRRGVRRTAWILGLVAIGVFTAFMLSAVIP